MGKYSIALSVEKVLHLEIEAESEEQAIELAKEKAMNSKEDFATILDVYVENN